MFNHKAFVGNQVNLAYNRKIGKWILMTGAGIVRTDGGQGMDAARPERRTCLNDYSPNTQRKYQEI